MGFFDDNDSKATGFFVAGVLFGTVGIKMLASKDAQKAYVHCTAAALRAKDVMMKKVSCIRKNAEEIYAEAKVINERRAAAGNDEQIL